MTRRRRITHTSSTVDGWRWGYGRSPPGYWGKWGDLDLTTAFALSYGGACIGLAADTHEGETRHRVRCRWSPGMRYAGGTVLAVTAERVGGVWWWVIEVSPKGAEVSDG